MKKYLLFITIFLALLIGCSPGSRTKEAVQQAQQNVTKADTLQGEINSNFYKIDIYCHDNNLPRITRLTNKICVGCVEQKKNYNQAIANMEQAKESTDDYQLKTFYDMRINALLVKVDVSENGFMYANKIEEETGKESKISRLLTLYNKIKRKQQQNYNDLMNEADRYMQLKQG